LLRVFIGAKGDKISEVAETIAAQVFELFRYVVRLESRCNAQ